MQIIDRIDINYFRSVYSITLSQCKDVNVIVGSNDAGKSNILKALNLFFNNETEPHSDFDFFKDLSRGREEEARSAKGRMSIWIKVHFKNFLGWKSLPPEFWVKRSWNRYEERPTDSFPEEITPTTLYRFLNKIRYHYIPAVRGREIFSDLLADLHDTLLQDENLGLRDSSQGLVSDLNRITFEMSDRIKQRLGIESTIQIPESLRDLFRALDFSTQHGEFKVPLNLRGDGIQSRHLPFILDYIASKSKSHHIWGYEEPENSLELSKSFEMAHDFTDNFSRENQIFLTTHSPAFYDIQSKRSSRWYVENSRGPDDAYDYTSAKAINSTHDVDKSMGLLAVLSPRMREANEQLIELRHSIEDMSTQLAQHSCPSVYVEGDTDVKILSHAAKLYGLGDDIIQFISSDGATNITQFIKVMNRVKSDQRVLIGLYDGDYTGRTEIARFQTHHLLQGTKFRVVNRQQKIYVASLSIPDHLQEVQRQFSSLGADIPLCLEFMFRPDILSAAQSEGILKLSPRKSKLGLNELPLEVNIEDILRGKIHNEYIYVVKKINESCKTNMTSWLLSQKDNHFDVFEPLIDEIKIAIDA